MNKQSVRFSSKKIDEVTVPLKGVLQFLASHQDRLTIGLLTDPFEDGPRKPAWLREARPRAAGQPANE